MRLEFGLCDCAWKLPSILESNGYEAIDAAKMTMLIAAIIGLISAFIFYLGLKGGVPEDSEEVGSQAWDKRTHFCGS